MYLRSKNNNKCALKSRLDLAGCKYKYSWRICILCCMFGILFTSESRSLEMELGLIPVAALALVVEQGCEVLVRKFVNRPENQVRKSVVAHFPGQEESWECMIGAEEKYPTKVDRDVSDLTIQLP